MPLTFTDPTKQEIWTTVRAMNDAWTRGNPDDLKRFFHPDMIAITPTDRNRLEGGAACIAGWKAFSKTARIHRWEELDPIINVFNNAAVVAYNYDMSFDMNDQTINMVGRDMLFFVKENGAWWAVADQFSPYPA